MKLVVGLGNPGPEYVGTRHNLGFVVLAELATKTGIRLCEKRFKGLFGKGRWASEAVALLEPMTFMNLSGRSVNAARCELDVMPRDVVVIYDDVDFPLGTVRVAERGSDGGHKGVRSILDEMETDEFARVRVGIGRPAPRGDVVEWVLGRFEEHELMARDQAVERAVEAVETIVRRGTTAAMNQFNRR